MRGNDDISAVERTLMAYLDTFNQADWEGFRTFFADDATAFSPWGAFAGRATGRDAVAWARRQALDLQGASSGAALPRIEPMVALGADFVW